MRWIVIAAILVLGSWGILRIMDTQQPTPPKDIFDEMDEKEEMLRKEAEAINGFVVFSRSDGWGPCPPGETCTENFVLYSSGKFEKNGVLIATLSKSEVDQILTIIKNEKYLSLEDPKIERSDYRTQTSVSDGTAKKTFTNVTLKPIQDVLKPYATFHD